MKRKIEVSLGNNKTEEREISYIPFRYITAIMITLLEVLAIIAVVVLLCLFVPYFYIAIGVTTFAVVIKIIASDDNPDYKVPWILFVLVLPIVGLMLYFIFGSRKLKKKYVKRLNKGKEVSYKTDDDTLLLRLKKENLDAFSQATALINISDSHIYTNTKNTYFSIGEEYYASLLEDIKNAEKFIFLEYFIIEEGKFWNNILEILKEKARLGVKVKVVFDDIGCMTTLSGGYAKELKKFNIDATPFSRLKGQADSEFNNRSHRKIAVIDGIIGYTGGINIADEYINEIVKHGHWKDVGVRIQGNAVWELTRLFLIDYETNQKKESEIKVDHYPNQDLKEKGYVIPFGDGPKPIFHRRVGKTAIENLLNSAKEYAFITTPYLIIDNELCSVIENTALRGVKVKIITPHVPDKKIIFGMTRSYYKRLLDAGVEIYEYEPGFIHAKTYLIDDKFAIIGTINLDYRSLVHHFENGIWFYNCECVKSVKEDIDKTLGKCIKITPEMLKTNFFSKLFRAIVRIFAPML